MENIIEKRNKTGNILLTIIIILILLLGGFIVYDNFLKKDDPVNSPKCEEKDCPTNECNCPSYDSNTPATATNSYQVFSTNLKKKIKSFSSRTFLAKNAHFEGYENDKPYLISYKVVLTNKSELILIFDESSSEIKYIEKYGKEIKIANNVISFTVAQAGPGAYQNIYFINENGTIGVAEPYDMFNYNKTKLSVTNPLSGYKNIVSIVQGSFDNVGSTQDPYAIDINGNAHAIQSYWD